MIYKIKRRLVARNCPRKDRVYQSKKWFVIALLSAGIFLGVSSVGAHAVRDASPAARRAAAIEKRCTVAEKRLAIRVSRYENNRQKHVTRYRHAHEVLTTAVTKLKAQGKNTTEAQQALADFETKIKKFDTDAATYIQELRDTQNHACGESEGEFRNELKEARSLLQILRADVLDIRDHYQTTVRPAMQALRGEQKAE